MPGGGRRRHGRELTTPTRYFSGLCAWAVRDIFFLSACHAWSLSCTTVSPPSSAPPSSSISRRSVSSIALHDKHTNTKKTRTTTRTGTTLGCSTSLRAWTPASVRRTGTGCIPSRCSTGGTRSRSTNPRRMTGMRGEMLTSRWVWRLYFGHFFAFFFYGFYVFFCVCCFVVFFCAFFCVC